MKFYAFNLMPYRHLDLEAARQHRAFWTVLPNDFYDSELGAQLYEEYLDQLTFAADLGFDGVCVNEHHQTAYGLMPAPNLIAATLIERTKGRDTKIPIIGRALPLVNNPLAIAEEFAMLDTLSRGRIIAGFVRGIGCEYHASGVNPAFSHERFHEAHDLIIRAWTETGPFAFQGEHYNFRYVNTWPRLYQRPRPPIWIPSQGSSETIAWAAAPERRYPFIITFSPFDAVMKYHQLYREQAEGYGYEATGDQLGWAVPVYVAETEEKARKEAETHIEALFNDFLKVPLEMLFPPGYTSIKSMQANLSRRQGMVVQRQSLKDLIDKGTFVVGTPASVADQLGEAQHRSGFEHLITMMQFGTLPDELARKNIELFATEVMPRLRSRAAASRANEPVQHQS